MLAFVTFVLVVLLLCLMMKSSNGSPDKRSSYIQPGPYQRHIEKSFYLYDLCLQRVSSEVDETYAKYKCQPLLTDLPN